MRKLQWLTLMSILILLQILLMSLRQTSSPTQNDLQQSIDRGKKVYTMRCLSCHLPEGTGIQNVNPSLIKTKSVLGNKEQLIQIIIKGMEAGTEIDSIKYNNVMPPAPDIRDLDIADVLTYVRNSFGNKAKAVTAADVKAVRAKTK